VANQRPFGGQLAFGGQRAIEEAMGTINNLLNFFQAELATVFPSSNAGANPTGEPSLAPSDQSSSQFMSNLLGESQSATTPAAAAPSVTASPIRVPPQSPEIDPKTEPIASPAPNLTAAQQAAELANDFAAPGSLGAETLNQQLNDPNNPWYTANGGPTGNSTVDYVTPGNANFGTPGNPVAAAFTAYTGSPAPVTTIPPNPNA
jgi:hypothetical protein